MGQNEYYDKVYKAKLVQLYCWTWAEIERRWRVEKEEGQIVRASYLCSDLVWPRAT